MDAAAAWSLDDIKEDKYIPNVSVDDLGSERNEAYYNDIHHDIEALKMRVDRRLESLLSEENEDFEDLSKQIDSLESFHRTRHSNLDVLSEASPWRGTKTEVHSGGYPALADSDSSMSMNIRSKTGLSEQSHRSHYQLGTTSSASTEAIGNSTRHKIARASRQRQRAPTPDGMFSGKRILNVLHESDDESDDEIHQEDDLVAFGLGEFPASPKSDPVEAKRLSQKTPRSSRRQPIDSSPRYRERDGIIEIEDDFDFKGRARPKKRTTDSEAEEIIHLESVEDDDETGLIDHIDFTRNNRDLPDPSPRQSSAPLLRDWNHPTTPTSSRGKSGKDAPGVNGKAIVKKEIQAPRYHITDEDVQTFLHTRSPDEGKGPNIWDSLVSSAMEKLTGKQQPKEPDRAYNTLPTARKSDSSPAMESREDISVGSEKREKTKHRKPTDHEETETSEDALVSGSSPKISPNRPDPAGNDADEVTALLNSKLHLMAPVTEQRTRPTQRRGSRRQVNRSTDREIPDDLRVEHAGSSMSRDIPLATSSANESNLINSMVSESSESFTNYTESFDSSFSGDPPTVQPREAKRMNYVRNMAYKDNFGDSGRYTGELKNGRPDGRGSLQYSDGRSYHGEWKGGHWHGRGKALFANGDVFHGTYRYDKRHGKGIYQYNDGRKYEGEYQHDKREGMGSFTWPDGSKYLGGFKAGKRDGKGHYVFPDGSTYTGHWKNGKYDGIGEVVWANGRRYRGDFKAGLAHGYGIEYRVDGSVRHDGRWDKDRPVREKKDKKASLATSFLRPPLGQRYTCG